MFKKEKREENADNPISLILELIKDSFEDPTIGVLYLLGALHKEGVLDEEDFYVIGIGNEELKRILNTLNSKFTYHEVRMDSYINGYLLKYKSEVDEVILKENLKLNHEERNYLMSRIARFAIKNNINDLKIAYRVMKNEGELE